MGVSSAVLAAVVVTLTTVTVQADAPLARPASTLAPSTPAVDSTPGLMAPEDRPPVVHKRQHGIASWYGGIFNGRQTANGERYNMNALTACHPSLPFGSLVRVINLHNHRSVVVRINDRNDLLEGRIIDLSYAAAQKLAMTEDGLASVRLEVLAMGHRDQN